MLSRSLVSLTAAAALLVLPSAAHAQLRQHGIDRAHSEINFTASSRLLDAHGQFDKWEAEVAVDSANPERSTVRITIDAASINTRVSRRDDHLRSADFLDAAKYPTIVFESKSIARTAEKAGTITGDLTMHGVTKSITVPVTAVFYGAGRGRFRGTFALNRSEWGVVGQSRMNPIEDAVEVQFNFSLTDKKPTP
jgi:polyisoprenoid-binding protein YceI